MDYSDCRYIITGGSGSGKSAIIKGLMKRGFLCYPEVSRKLIREQQECNGDMLPWKDMNSFARECFVRMKQQLIAEKTAPVFFDRGIPDIIAYLESRKLPVNVDYGSYSLYYNSTLFLCPPWGDIFVNDRQRPESFEESRIIYTILKRVYQQLNFKIIELPFISVEERIDFILSNLEA